MKDNANQGRPKGNGAKPGLLEQTIAHAEEVARSAGPLSVAQRDRLAAILQGHQVKR